MAKDTTKADAAYAEALTRIAACKKAGGKGTTLDLTRLGLTRLPPGIGALRGLTALDVSRNQFTSLSLNNMNSLENLNISYNLCSSISLTTILASGCKADACSAPNS